MTQDSTGRNRETRMDATGRVRNMWSEGTTAEVELDVDLVGAASNPAYIEVVEGAVARHDALLRQGYAPPVALKSITDARDRSGIDQWWTQAATAAEHGGDSHIPKVRLDSSPSQMAGAAVTGLRRTYRKAYEVDGYTFRWGGSKTAILRDMDEAGSNTIDLEVEVTTPDGPNGEKGASVHMEVRVTRGANGLWAVSPKGAANPKSDMVAAGVQAVLEARRPTMVPEYVGGLAQRAKDKMATQGVVPEKNVTSTWISSVNYLESDGVMTMTTSKGVTYGYSVDRTVAHKMATSTKPGQVFHELLRNKGLDVKMTECDSCHAVYAAKRSHRCAPKPAEPMKVEPAHNAAHRYLAQAIARSVVRRRKPKTDA